MHWEVFLATFPLIFLAEVGDKTQLAVVAMSSGHSIREKLGVWAGGSLALSALAFIGAGVAGTAANFLKEWQWLIMIGAGLLFIVFGFLTLKGDGDDDDEGFKKGKSAWALFRIALIGVFFAELGDKTQIATLAQGAKFADEWLTVAVAAAAALTAITTIAVAASFLIDKFPKRVVTWTAAILFFILGIMYVLEGAGVVTIL